MEKLNYEKALKLAQKHDCEFYMIEQELIYEPKTEKDLLKDFKKHRENAYKLLDSMF